MKIFIFFLFFIISSISFSQKGQIEISADPRIDALIKQEGAVIPPATSPQINGYRIQLYFDSEKNKVDEARSKFINLFPKVDTYVHFNAPNYFLKVGDFRTQNEAEKIKSSVESQFPTSFIVKEKINLPRIDQ
ncbi:MAG: SPOR domain-containing protein [Flavobacteriia bacterium]|nr:SPOR domain-containing protein [Flavobacteriia bacterium]